MQGLRSDPKRVRISCSWTARRRATRYPSRTNALDKILDILKTEAEIAKLMAETQKLNLEARWMPFVWSGSIIAVAIAVAKYFAS